MARHAFELSEAARLPVVLRLVTRLAHSRSDVAVGTTKACKKSIASPGRNPHTEERSSSPNNRRNARLAKTTCRWLFRIMHRVGIASSVCVRRDACDKASDWRTMSCGGFRSNGANLVEGLWGLLSVFQVNDESSTVSSDVMLSRCPTPYLIIKNSDKRQESLVAYKPVKN